MLAENFIALKIRRLRPGFNPRTWVQKASTLPLEHQSRFNTYLLRELQKTLLGNNQYPKNMSV
jgi:hypothetical protein